MESCCRRQELAVGSCSEFDVLIGVGARAYRTEHLLATEDELDRLLNDFGGHGGEDGVRPDVALAAEAAAGERTLDVDVGRGDARRRGRGSPGRR